MRLGTRVTVVREWTHGIGPRKGATGVIVGRHWKYRRVRFDDDSLFTMPTTCLEVAK